MPKPFESNTVYDLKEMAEILLAEDGPVEEVPRLASLDADLIFGSDFSEPFSFSLSWSGSSYEEFASDLMTPTSQGTEEDLSGDEWKLPIFREHRSARPPTSPLIPRENSDSSEDLSDPKRRQHDGKFPFCPGGRCEHRDDWTRVRGKRAYAYFFCRYCGLGWRARRPPGPQGDRKTREGEGEAFEGIDGQERGLLC